MEFEWDDSKAEANLRKHGVSFDEAASVLGDPLAITFFDPAHSDDKDRFLTIGMSKEGRVVILSHTDRDDRIRIISAREATRGERRGYEDGTYP
jgi:uncharacterized DUF497 family protein